MPMQMITGTGGTLQLGGPGVAVCLEAIEVGTPVASSVVTVYKGVGTAGTIIATLDAATKDSFYINSTILGGVYITVTGGAAKVSVVYD